MNAYAWVPALLSLAQCPPRPKRYAASPELVAYVLRVAPPHYPTPNAPSDYQSLVIARKVCERLPVFDGGCEATIYPSPAVNHAFRAWHDAIHLTLCAGFDAPGELAVAREHERQARAAGLSELDVCTLFFDTWGQFRYAEMHGGAFPTDQAAFVAACFARGMSAAILETH